jgi:hypothetical protein
MLAHTLIGVWIGRAALICCRGSDAPATGSIRSSIRPASGQSKREKDAYPLRYRTIDSEGKVSTKGAEAVGYSAMETKRFSPL